MIVFDLRCEKGHVFEAWFASGATFESQRGDGVLVCPACGNDKVDKAVMAPAVARTTSAPTEPIDKAGLAALATVQRQMLDGSRWVGRDFADRARAMHDGEEPPATIHGQATRTEAVALIQDGVPVAPLPFPLVPADRLN